MAVAEKTVLKITCDNPACPGNTLDPKDRLGWVFVSHEVYGEPTQSNVYCCSECAGHLPTAIDEARPVEGPVGPPVELPPPEPG